MACFVLSFKLPYMEDMKEQDLRADAEHVSMKAAFVNFKNSTQEIVDTYYRLGIATATQKGADVAAASVGAILMAVFGLFVFLFLFIGLAFWIGTLVNSTAGGFLIVGGFFALLLILVIALKGKVIYPIVRNTIVKKVYEQQNNSGHNNV